MVELGVQFCPNCGILTSISLSDHKNVYFLIYTRASRAVSCGSGCRCHPLLPNIPCRRIRHSLVEVEFTNAAQEGQEASQEIEDENLAERARV